MIKPRFGNLQCTSPAGPHRMGWTEWGDPNNPDVLMCVHGLSRVGRDFDALAHAMCDRYRVVCPDIVGRGRSDWLRDPLHYHVPQYVADCALLLEQLGAKAVHWVGTSMGGLIGMGLAAHQPQAIGRLMLNDVGPVLSGRALSRIADYLGVDISFAQFDDGVQYIKAISAPFGTHTEKQWRALSKYVLVKRGGAWRLHYDPKIASNFALAAQLNPTGVDTLLWDLYDAVRCPTFVIRGETSDLLTREVHREMAERGPRASIVEFANVGHAPTLMQPDQIAVVREWLIDDPAIIAVL